METHGQPLYELINSSASDERKIFFVHGGVSAEEREQVREITEKEDNAIIVASYGTCSTGINIKNINAIIFASPSKSVVRVLQSIGRGLRKSETKDNVVVYDIGDDLHFKSYRNHTLRHMDERLTIYNNEKFTYKTVKVKLGAK